MWRAERKEQKSLTIDFRTNFAHSIHLTEMDGALLWLSPALPDSDAVATLVSKAKDWLLLKGRQAVGRGGRRGRHLLY